ncbi:type ISP restriction/modification enzyme [Actinomadura litoris]|uniref:type ISP restriction/modification enzyme n=1 Tax=Actinomadura litoris TaxID=2678616 RepID=UPI001FA7E030|nr:type ISP restriction/modification enzyme [Actinomadura litoris]
MQSETAFTVRVVPSSSEVGVARSSKPEPKDVAQAVVAEFGRTVSQKRGLGGAEEDQLRGPLEILLRKLGTFIGVEAVPYGEVRLDSLRARPDYAVNIGQVRVGYVELKKPGKGVPGVAEWRPGRGDREQWIKLRSLPNVIYTDGVTWAQYSYGERISPIIRLANTISDLRRPSAPAVADLVGVLRRFLLWEPESPRTLTSLVKILGGLCGLLKDEVHAAITDPLKDRSQVRLALLADDWRDLLFPGLDNERFADAFAQTITFALLLARVDGIDLLGETYHEIAQKLGKRHLLMGQAFAVLTSGVDDELDTTETLRRVINVADLNELDLNPADAYAYLYERFLATYDPELRKDTGSYYTPIDVARHIVRFVDEVLQEHLGKEWGLADDDIVIVDPAMGTGTFLVEIIGAVADRVGDKLGPGTREDFVHDLVSKRLIGFEIQVAPYAVAELRIHGSFKTRFQVETPPKARRFLTDALADPNHVQRKLGAPYRVMEQARDEANDIKLKVPVMVVIGNPPHVENAKGRAPWIEHPRRGKPAPRSVAERPSIDEFRAAGLGRYESDLHGMPWYFLRWAAWKVFEAEQRMPAGVVAFIVPSSVTRSRAFSGLREYLRRKCKVGWVIELTPEGNRPPMATRIFGPDVGRQLSILIFANASCSDEEEAADVRYVELTGTGEEKRSALERLKTTDPRWQRCSSEWQDAFLPAGAPTWTASPSLGDLMPWRSRGVTPGRTWVYAPTADLLHDRWRAFLAAPLKERRELFREGRDRTLHSKVKPLPGFPRARQPLAEESGPCPEPVQVAYRSFDRQWLIPDNRLLVMARPPLWQVRSERQIYVSEQDAHQIEGGPALTFTGLVPDLHHFCGWGGGGARPLWRDPVGDSPNMTEELLNHLSSVLELPVSPPDVLAYIAAVAAHPGYTHRFKRELRQPGVRVPLTADPTLWNDALTTGHEVLWLHTYGSRATDPAMTLKRSERAVVERFGIKCLTPVRSLPEQLPERLSYEPDTQTLHVGSGAFAPVRQEVIDYTVSGRRVVWRWLNDRTTRPRNKRKSSQLDDITPTTWSRNLTFEFLALLSVLTGCVLLHPEQERLLNEICAGPLISKKDLHDAGVLPVPLSATKPPSSASSDPSSLPGS